MPRKKKNRKVTRKTKKKMNGGTLTEGQKSMATLYRIRKPEIEREMEKYSFLEFLMDKDPQTTLTRKREYNQLITDRVISNKEIPEHDKPRIERTIKHIIDPNIEPEVDIIRDYYGKKKINFISEIYDPKLLESKRNPYKKYDPSLSPLVFLSPRAEKAARIARGEELKRQTEERAARAHQAAWDISQAESRRANELWLQEIADQTLAYQRPFATKIQAHWRGLQGMKFAREENRRREEELRKRYKTMTKEDYIKHLQKLTPDRPHGHWLGAAGKYLDAPPIMIPSSGHPRNI